MDDTLRKAAHEGKIPQLYASIQGDGDVLRRIDEIQFVETPLHIAAAEGCIDFAVEIMNLMPSFAKKLSPEGLSPLHLAVDRGHKELALLLVENDKDLVRVKGRNGETPFHHAATKGNRDLLERFMTDCPECILDITTKKETALHIATRNNDVETFRHLHKMLRKKVYSDCCHEVVNQKDTKGDTVLHIAARNNQPEMLKVLLGWSLVADKFATNQDDMTALDVARQSGNKESIDFLRRGSQWEPLFFRKTLFEYRLSKRIQNTSKSIFQGMENISSDDRNALLVVWDCF